MSWLAAGTAAEAEARASEANAQAAALKMRLARMQMEGGRPQSEDPPVNPPPTEEVAVGSPGIPLGCLRWFDGCNTCGVTPEGELSFRCEVTPPFPLLLLTQPAGLERRRNRELYKDGMH